MRIGICEYTFLLAGTQSRCCYPLGNEVGGRVYGITPDVRLSDHPSVCHNPHTFRLQTHIDDSYEENMMFQGGM